MGMYIKESDVEVRLLGKVRFTDDTTDENKFQRSLLKRLVSEAESDVELDLSPRYFAPFQTDTGGSFNDLPERPTRNTIRNLCEIKSVMNVIDTDFGRGSVADATKYYETLQKRYESLKTRLLERRKDSFNQWFYPPLPNLMLNYMNESGDDGFLGSVHVTSQGRGGFPGRQINDPAATPWTGGHDHDDGFEP